MKNIIISLMILLIILLGWIYWQNNRTYSSEMMQPVYRYEQSERRNKTSQEPRTLIKLSGTDINFIQKKSMNNEPLVDPNRYGPTTLIDF